MTQHEPIRVKSLLSKLVPLTNLFSLIWICLLFMKLSIKIIHCQDFSQSFKNVGSVAGRMHALMKHFNFYENLIWKPNYLHSSSKSTCWSWSFQMNVMPTILNNKLKPERSRSLFYRVKVWGKTSKQVLHDL